MNGYLYELKNHFRRLRYNVRFSNVEADVYDWLIGQCNELQWENPFPMPTWSVCSPLGISRKTLIEVRNKLKQKGLIDFKEGSRNAQEPVYELLILKDLVSLRNQEGNQKNGLVSTGNQLGNQEGNQEGNQLRNQLGNQEGNPIRENKNKRKTLRGDASLTPESEKKSLDGNTQKSVKGVKPEKKERAARVNTRNPLWMKHFADFRDVYPETYRNDEMSWRQAERLFDDLLHKGGVNDDDSIIKRGKYLVRQAHWYGELCRHEHRSEQFIKSAAAWLSDESDYAKPYKKIIEAMPKNGVPEGMVL